MNMSRRKVISLIAMRFAAVCAVSAMGCGCAPVCESFAGYSIYGTAVDAANGMPIASGTASVVLYRDGRVIVAGGILQYEVIDENGAFDAGIEVVATGGNCGDPLVSLPSLASLGEPPDEAVVYVRSEGRVGIASITITQGQISYEDEQTGIIELGTVEITLLEPNAD